MPNISDYLQQVVSGATVPVVNTWVQFVNNTTSVTYVSSAATNATGFFTILSIPPGTYTVNVSSASTGPWSATGDTNYFIGADVNSANTFNATQSISSGNLTLTDSASKIIPGATSISLRDHANANDNLLVNDSGLITVRNTLTISSGGASVTGGVSSTSEVSGTDFKASGLSPLAQIRLVGLSSSGPPTSGTFATGDYVVSTLGGSWICTAGGSPGTWAPVGWAHYSSFIFSSAGPDTSSAGDIAIPAGATHAKIIWRARDTSANTVSSFAGMQIAVNNGSIDQANHYSWTEGTSTSNPVASTPGGVTNATQMYSVVTCGAGDGSSSTGQFNTGEIDLPFYSFGSRPTFTWRISQANPGNQVGRFGSGVYWANEGPVTKVRFFSTAANFAVNTAFHLFVSI